MNNLFVKTGDTVVLLTGDDKYRGKEGKVLAVSPKEGKVIVEGLNVVKKHVKPRKQGETGGIVDAMNDHRIAMSAAIAATSATGPVTIKGAECVKKSYPKFWDEYSRLGGNL